MYAVTIFGFVCWTTYGLLAVRGRWPVSNAICVVLTLTVFILRVRFGGGEAEKRGPRFRSMAMGFARNSPGTPKSSRSRARNKPRLLSATRRNLHILAQSWRRFVRLSRRRPYAQ